MTATGGGGDPLAAVEHGLMRVIRQATRPAMDRWLATVGGVSLDRADYVALARIEETEPVRPTELAEVLGVDISTVSRQVRDLVQSSLVDRGSDPDDQRACRLRLTDEGRAVLNRLRAARQERVRRLLEDWSDADRALLARLMTRLADDMERRSSFDPATGSPSPAPVAAGGEVGSR